MRCDRFDGFPCLTDGKADAHVLLRAPGARARERHARDAREGRAARDGRARGARSPRGGRPQAARARATAATSWSSPAAPPTRAALLLRSANDRHPNGLANSSDVVGRNYMAHINSGVIAISQTPNDDQVPEDARGERLLLGRRGLGASARAHPDARQVGPQHPARPGRRGSRPAWRWTTWPSTRSTSGSRPRTCPTRTTGSRVDRQGNIHLAKTFHNDEPHRRLLAQAEGPARGHSAAIGADDPALVGARPAHPACRHRAPVRHGSVRRATPQTSVLDVNCKAHDARQPLRRRHELLPVVLRGEPGADRDGERAAGGRPPAGAARTSGRRPRSPSERRPTETEEVAA